MKFLPRLSAKAVGLFLSVLLTSFVPAASVAQSTDIQVTAVVQQPSVKRLGINLGDQTSFDSGQLLKNLVFQNPGFEYMKYRSIMICQQVTANTCMDDNQYSPQQTGYWAGGHYLILSGKSSGQSGTVIASTKNTAGCAGCGQIIQFDQNLSTAVGDYFVLTQTFPGNGDQGWSDSTSGGAIISTETTDLSPNTKGSQAIVLNASGTGQSASVTEGFDNEGGISFIQMKGNYQATFRAKGVGGNNQLKVTVLRFIPTGTVNYLNQTVTLTNTWQDYNLTFPVNESGAASGTAQLIFAATGSSVELDDVSLNQTDSDPTNTTAFRDDVVNALKQLKPGTLRMMAAGAGLGSDLPNQIQPVSARYREGYSTGAVARNTISYGIDEFLHLSQAVGADPWITIPTATTPTEMSAFMQYLLGDGTDQYSALRVSRGQVAPWPSVFDKIHIEFGNETWNGSFRGESVNYNAYPAMANQVFTVARQTPGYVASKFDLVVDGIAANPSYNKSILNISNQHDSIDIAPYLLYSANDEPQATMFGALFAEPEWYETTGEVAQNQTTAATAKTPTYLNVYETNLGTETGNITAAELAVLAPSLGAGLAHTVHMLEMMRIGIRYQNAFSLTQYDYKRSDQKDVHLWGTVVDMGTTNRRRPQFLTHTIANAVIGGDMLQTVQTGLNPTWNQPLSSDKVQLANAHEIQSFAFSNGSVIVFNLSQTTARTVTFSGAAPAGSVSISQITSANITDNNEASNVVVPTTTAVANFDPTVPLSLPPFSMTVISLVQGSSPPPPPAVQAPVFSPGGGTYYNGQPVVTISSVTPGATVYYTSNGTTPTSSSLQVTGPVTVKMQRNLKAIAILGANQSDVTEADYVLAAATPVFSLDAGTYSGTQTLTITEDTPGVAVYYTTNNGLPNTTSTKYTGPVTISSTVTIRAFAAATNYISSPVVTKKYTIQP